MTYSLSFEPLLADDPEIFLGEHPNLLGYQDFAQSVAGLIEAIPRCSLLALWGAWGSGKTRILRLLAQELAGKVILIDFNPWISANLDNWIPALTSEVTEATCIHLLEIEKTLDDEAIKTACRDAVVDSRRVQTTNFFKSIGRGLAEKYLNIDPSEAFKVLRLEEINKEDVARLSWEATIEQLYKQLNSQCGYETRLVVLLDDLDRCEPRFMKSVLDTCFGSLRRANVTFVIAADRDSVLESLAEILPRGDRAVGKRYLEKVLSIDVSTPVPTKAQIVEFVTLHEQGSSQRWLELPVFNRIWKHVEELQAKENENVNGSQEKANRIKTRLNLRNHIMLEAIVLNPRRIKRILIRYTRLIYEWNKLFRHDLDQSGSFPYEKCTSTLAIAYGFTVLKEVRPGFFERFLSNAELGYITLMIAKKIIESRMADYQDHGVYEEVYKSLIEFGLLEDKPLLNVLNAICTSVPHSILQESVDGGLRLALMS